MQRFWGLIAFALIFLASCKEEKDPQQSDEQQIEAIEEKAPEVAYGFELDDFEVIRDTVRSGDSFGGLMLAQNIDYNKVEVLSKKFRDTFDIRRIRVGRPYMILKSRDSVSRPEVFVYENDLINYTVVDFRDSVNAFKGRKPIKYVEREASGVIPQGGSLSDVVVKEGIDYLMVNELSEVYAWTIDFFKLDAGDKFKIIYDELYINDSVDAGAGHIKAAYFEHRGQPIYAFAYESDSLKNVVDYYDEEANNLRRTFLRAPLKFGRLSSRYNLRRRIKYYGYRVRPHRGTDYAAPIGTPILATADGVVTESTRKGGNGKYVKIRHNSTYSTQYLHMKAQKVKRGEFVKQGDVIGWIGMTGNTGGPHVCYRFWKNGRQVDPLREDLPAAEPLAEALRPKFYEYINPIKYQLDCIPYNEPAKEQLLTSNP
ncbi:peptidoglycan DD-metalloendopeptidase family protein [Lentiprolixibacter aurantiacus]|uniref:Peptidoglycan DD-metalloendopeptidase family protein n=1 Tax=Lentiprolixibacter aurantiacus TaxID=2993939 RepID=A0AAE3SNC9_9FLAO|nr:peptidoglycan DD-metalloendopeptidase family protein [Lentiprolixibacter aurantiacus]MCX2718322.1 peptidoglycan DD-metalloendopeptidase family protein [Lentiprolixibacter aurantiacus]